MGGLRTATDALERDIRKSWPDVVTCLRALGSIGAACGGRLVLTGSSLEFPRTTGLYVPIAGNLEEIPASPPSLSASGVVEGTIYYIYAFISGGTVTLERSTTGYTQSTSWGYPVKTGDTSRTLVGLVRGAGTNAYADTPASRQVATYYNRIRRSLFGVITADRTITATTPTEIHTEMRCNVVVWADEVIDFSIIGQGPMDDAFGLNSVYGAMDSTSSGFLPPTGWQAYTTNAWGSCSTRVTTTAAEGYHFLSALGAVDSAGRVTTFNSDRLGLIGTILP